MSTDLPWFLRCSPSPADELSPARPRFRFGLRALILLPALAAVPLMVARLPVGRWGAGKRVLLEFRVVDATTGLPVRGAEIAVVHPYHPEYFPPSRGTTDDEGRIVIVTYLKASGEVLVAGKTERLSAAGGRVVIAADGYESERRALTPADARPTTIVFSLRKRRDTPAKAP